MISSNDIAKSVRTVLRDNFAASGYAYSDGELVEFINRGIKYCGTINQSMTVRTSLVPMVAGYIQKLPNESSHLVSVASNGLDVTTTETVGLRTYDGQAPVQPISNEFMMQALRNYTGQPRKKIVTMVAPMVGTPYMFSVFPPNDGTGKLLCAYRDEIPTITALANDDLHLENFYESPIAAYAVYAALTRDGDDNPLAADGKVYLELCNTQLKALATNNMQQQQNAQQQGGN